MGKEILYKGMSLSEWISNIDKINCKRMKKNEDGTITLDDYCLEKKCNNSQLCIAIMNYTKRIKREKEENERLRKMLIQAEIIEVSRLFDFTFNPDRYPVLPMKKPKAVKKETVETSFAMESLFDVRCIPRILTDSQRIKWEKAYRKRDGIERGAINRKRTMWIKGLQFHDYFGCPQCRCDTAEIYVDRNLMKGGILKSEEIYTRYKCIECGHLYDVPEFYREQRYTEQELKDALEEVGMSYDKLYLYANNEESVKRIEEKLKTLKDVPNFGDLLMEEA